MAAEWSVIFQGVSAASAVVQAVRAALEMKKLSREQLDQAIAQSGQAKVDDEGAEADMMSIDPETAKTLKGKIDEASQRYRDNLVGSNDPVDWQGYTDQFQTELCQILRIIRNLNGNRLPRKWLKLWVANACR